jgi:hypothetical protein
MRNIEAVRAARRRWYYRHKKKAIRLVKHRQKTIAEWLKEYKRGLRCVKCGEKHPSCLDFHHKNPKEKDLALSMVARNGWGKERILREIKKCLILCSNCHRKLHWNGV